MAEKKPRGIFKSGEPWTEPHDYCAGDRDGRTKAEFVEARRPAPLSKTVRNCKLCNHPERTRIEALRVSGVSIDKLAEQSAKEGRSVLDYLVIVRSMNQLAREAELNRTYAVERVAGRLIDTLKEIGVITGEVSRLAGVVFNVQNNTQIINSPPFLELQQGLLEVCARHPEARMDIIALFHDLDHRHAGPALPFGRWFGVCRLNREKPLIWARDQTRGRRLGSASYGRRHAKFQRKK